MISKEQTKHIAKLARIELNKKEIEKYQGELSKILDYIEKLKEVNVEGIQPMSHPVEIKNIMREDKKRQEKEGKMGEKLLEMVPDKKNRYLKTKGIL
ncbi:Asp-tRNA(Asn)/Glu-tRNA(Gln) amidotransferase subunit GatC [bacterium]|nr:Asp-tRNA(Asn)/Glu-tRNA(Gln) amidotransferase subunit GatC [bacterium]